MMNSHKQKENIKLRWIHIHLSCYQVFQCKHLEFQFNMSTERFVHVVISNADLCMKLYIRQSIMLIKIQNS